jgi:hypothetical protein
VPHGDVIYDEREEKRMPRETEREQVSRVAKSAAATGSSVAHCEEDDKGTAAGSVKEEEAEGGMWRPREASGGAARCAGQRGHTRRRALLPGPGGAPNVGTRMIKASPPILWFVCSQQHHDSVRSREELHGSARHELASGRSAMPTATGELLHGGARIRAEPNCDHGAEHHDPHLVQSCIFPSWDVGEV